MRKIPFCHPDENRDPVSSSVIPAKAGIQKTKTNRNSFCFLSGFLIKSGMTLRKPLLLLIVFLLTVSPYISPSLSAAPEINTLAVNYLKSKSPSPWTTMALVAAGETSLTGDHLKASPGTQAINYTAPIMAIAALGQDPRTYPSEDFVAKLKTFHTSGQIGDTATLNDDIFGILALVAAGELVSDSAIQDAKTTVLNNQNVNGGWPFALGSNPDTNMTAMALMALSASGLSYDSSVVQHGLAYLQSVQNDDGGFPYDPQSPYGTASDASSDAWVMSALYALDIDPASWEKNGNDPIKHLKTLQTATGYFQYQSGTGEDAFSWITTSYAVIALAGKGYPVGVFHPTNNSGEPLVTLRILGIASTVCAGSFHAFTALAVVENAASTCGYTYTIEQTSFGPYLSKINNDQASGLTGWRYRVNDILPNVGAADYDLTAGDSVLWYFGDSDEPRDAGNSVDLHARVTSSSGGGSGSTVSFTVTPDALEFGDLASGASTSNMVTIANTGTTAITVEALVTGDVLFTQNLKLNGGRWTDYTNDLATQNSENVEASLTIPSNTQAGDKTGTLIFWAIAQ